MTPGTPSVARRRPVRPSLSVEQLDERCLLAGGLIQTNLLSDIPGAANGVDPNLLNPWGIALDSTGHLRVSVNNLGLAGLYGANDQVGPLSTSVQISPGPSSQSQTSTPTALIFNNGTGFDISENGRTAPSLFLVASADGTISGWNPAVDPTHTVLVVDNSAWNPLQGDVYTGLAFGQTASGPVLYAVDFRSTSIDAFDQHFNQVQLSGSFTDPAIPAGFAPFNIQNINGNLYVTYALQDAAKYGEVAGPGYGYVDVFDTNGQLLWRLASQGALNAPWGLAQAPAQFGAFGNDLLIGNVGDGHINAYDPQSGAFRGSLLDGEGNAITIAGLWGLQFASDQASGSGNSLFFTAGGIDQNHGLLGKLQVAENSTPGNDLSDPFTKSQRAGKDTYPLPPAKAAPVPETESTLQPLPLTVLLPLRQPIKASASAAAVQSDKAAPAFGGPQALVLQGTGSAAAQSSDGVTTRLSTAAITAGIDAFFLQSRPSAWSIQLPSLDDAEGVSIVENQVPRQDNRPASWPVTIDSEALVFLDEMPSALISTRSTELPQHFVPGNLSKGESAAGQVASEPAAPHEDMPPTNTPGEGRYRWLKPVVGVLLAFGARLAWGQGHAPGRIIYASTRRSRLRD